MPAVQFSKVSLAFGDRDILRDVSLNFSSGMKAALAGANGSGKSTLMKILAGVMQPDSGARALEKGTRISWLPQSGLVHKGRTLEEEALGAFSRCTDILRQMEELDRELASASARRAGQLGEERDRLQYELSASGWERRKGLTEQTLLGLGFAREDFSRQVEEFSGGWQMRIALAKILLEKPDILLLDEPTNYLDLEARRWLEGWLQSFSGGFLVVSHDRFFLDKTVNEVYELSGGKLTRYASCTYSGYEQRRAEENAALLLRYKEQQEEIARQELFIRRFRYKATKAAAVQSRIKQLEKLERIEIPEALKTVRFSFPPAPHCGRIVLTAEGIGKTYASSSVSGGKCVLRGVDFTLEKGEKVVVAGRNGAGKSTLLRILAGVDPDFTGTVVPGAGVRTGWFSQDSAGMLDAGGRENTRILDLLEEEAPSGIVPKLRDMLGAFLFRGDDVFKPLGVLSGGERNRLALLRLLFRPLNLLILDEPTNHLDIHAKDVLLDTLQRFDGSVIFVSHDQGFIEGLATRVLELTAGTGGAPSRVRNFPGSYADYLFRLSREDAAGTAGTSGASGASGAMHPGTAAASPPGTAAGSAPSPDAARTQASGRGLSYQEEKQRRAARRKLEREEERLLASISAEEAQIAQLQQELDQPAVYADREKSRAVQQEIDARRETLAALTASWEEISAQLL